MNRVDRLFSIVVRLQARRRIRAEDLASDLGVSRRTIYRDIAALSEAGIPVVSLPGQGYELVEGFFLPPVRFTVDEANALVLGARLLDRQGGGGIALGARSAVAKIETLLTGPIRDRVGSIAGAIDFITLPGRFDLDVPHVEALQGAIAARKLVRLRYHSLSAQETTERTVEPERLWYGDGTWYVSAYCRLRGGPRDFRLSRIEDLAVLDEEFEPRIWPDRDDTGPPAAGIDVRILVPGHTVRWVRERQHYAIVDDVPADGADQGARVFAYRVTALSEIVHWIRAWGPAVTVLSPDDLRRSLREEAERLAEMLT